MSDRRHDETGEEAYAGDYDENPAEQGKLASALIALAGVWLMIEPFLIEPIVAGNFWNDILVGALLLVLGGYNYYRRSNDELGNTAVAGMAALLGLWLIVAPWVYGIDTPGGQVVNELGFWNDIVVGLVVLVLGVYSVYESRTVDVMTPASD
jgi:hypothetical protein